MTEIGFQGSGLNRAGRIRVEGAKDARDIPEPLYFDLIRPLGAVQGELEVNVLAVTPLKKRPRANLDAPDELGLVPLSADRTEVEWAPEIEFAPWDGVALEAEFPFEGSQLEALKFAGQWTLGTAFEERFIHGIQGIWQREVESSTSTGALLYLVGYRWNDSWSLMSMTGVRHEFGEGDGNRGGDRTELLQNTSVFHDLTDRISLGLETNWALSTRGRSTLRVLPQLQYEATHHLSFQAGLGFAWSRSEILPEAVLRVVLSR